MISVIERIHTGIGRNHHANSLRTIPPRGAGHPFALVLVPGRATRTRSRSRRVESAVATRRIDVILAENLLSYLMDRADIPSRALRSPEPPFVAAFCNTTPDLNSHDRVSLPWPPMGTRESLRNLEMNLHAGEMSNSTVSHTSRSNRRHTQPTARAWRPPVFLPAAFTKTTDQVGTRT